jgi:CheY-like chemotaxis protein
LSKKKRPRAAGKSGDGPGDGPSWEAALTVEVAAIVHDLRNVFSAIRGYATVIRDELRPDDAARADVDLILQAVDRGVMVSHRLSAFRSRVAQDGAPLDQSPAPDDAALDQSGSWMLHRPKRSATILVVEDDGLLRSMIVRLLRRNGYTTLEAGNGTEAEERVLAYGLAVDLMLVDVGLPGVSGPEIVERLKPRWPAVKVLFMSGFGRAALAERGLRPGPHLLEKPFSPPALLERVEAMLAPGTS